MPLKKDDVKVLPQVEAAAANYVAAAFDLTTVSRGWQPLGMGAPLLLSRGKPGKILVLTPSVAENTVAYQPRFTPLTAAQRQLKDELSNRRILAAMRGEGYPMVDTIRLPQFAAAYVSLAFFPYHDAHGKLIFSNPLARKLAAHYGYDVTGSSMADVDAQLLTFAKTTAAAEDPAKLLRLMQECINEVSITPFDNPTRQYLVPLEYVPYGAPAVPIMVNYDHLFGASFVNPIPELLMQLKNPWLRVPGRPATDDLEVIHTWVTENMDMARALLGPLHCLFSDEDILQVAAEERLNMPPVLTQPRTPTPEEAKTLANWLIAKRLGDRFDFESILKGIANPNMPLWSDRLQQAQLFSVGYDNRTLWMNDNTLGVDFGEFHAARPVKKYRRRS